MKKAVVILGPTATGKTDLGLVLAGRLNGEIIACDSRQVYRFLDIGTGKEPFGSYSIEKHHLYWKVKDIKIWMYDVVDPSQRYTVKAYTLQVKKIIQKISATKKLPIIVGGTGLYLRSLTDGLSNLSIPVDLKLRAELESLNLLALQEKLKQLSISKWQNLNDSDKKNKLRLLRSIELISMNPYIGKEIFGPILKEFDVIKIGLTAPRPEIRQRINKRLDLWFEQGFIDEGIRLVNTGVSFLRMRELGLEYSLLADYFQGSIDYQTLVEKLRTKNLQYAKRQMTWFKKEPDVNWFDVTTLNWMDQVENTLISWYHS